MVYGRRFLVVRADALHRSSTFRSSGRLCVAFPLLLGSVLAMGVLCLVLPPRRVWIPLFGLLVASGSIRTYAPINLLGSPSTGVAEGEIRVMTYTPALSD